MRLQHALLVAAAGLLAATCAVAPKPPPSLRPGAPLRPLSELMTIEDADARGLALFAEVGRVLKHPRCVNCHPATERPLQGAGEPHQPLAVRGVDGHGVAGQGCSTCHGAANYEHVPGHPHWRLAPAEMAWEGKALGEICAQLKDPHRNGGRSLDALVHHMAEDSLIAYGWNPPAHLEPAPSDQATVAALLKAWVDAGAPCPAP